MESLSGDKQHFPSQEDDFMLSDFRLLQPTHALSKPRQNVHTVSIKTITCICLGYLKYIGFKSWHGPKSKK
jgi:hypothetical protein